MRSCRVDPDPKIPNLARVAGKNAWLKYGGTLLS